MLTTYRNKICIVTGASSGIGEAFARELARRGAKVALFARRAEKLNAVAASLAGDHLAVVGDVTKARDRANLVETTLEKWGRIDVLINNAGRGDGAESFIVNDLKQIEQVIQINYLSAVLLTHMVIPGMIERRHGLIINVSSPMADLSVPGRTLYGSTKAALSVFSRTLYREVRKQGIHVLDLKPGFTRSEIVPPERDAKLPPLIRVKEVEPVVRTALDAALRGKPDLMTGGLLMRIVMILLRSWPRVGDFLLARVKIN